MLRPVPGVFVRQWQNEELIITTDGGIYKTAWGDEYIWTSIGPVPLESITEIVND